MSIAICFNNKDPEPWRQFLQQKLTEVNIEIYPEITDKHRVTFALCWKADKNILTQFPNLKVVQSVGASIDHLTLNQDLPKDITLSRIVDKRLSSDMYEFLLAGILSHIKGFSAYSQDKDQKKWVQRNYKTIPETNVAILGLGKIGALVGSQLANLGFMVKGWAQSEKDIPKVSAFFGELGLKETMKDADILINILPLTPATKNILNRQTLSLLKSGAYLINVGRGEHLVENDLLVLLDSGHLSGALLDVFRTEPLPLSHPFWKQENIRITPHVAALTQVDSAADIVVTNYRRMLAGQELMHLASLEKGY